MAITKYTLTIVSCLIVVGLYNDASLLYNSTILVRPKDIFLIESNSNSIEDKLSINTTNHVRQAKVDGFDVSAISPKYEHSLRISKNSSVDKIIRNITESATRVKLPGINSTESFSACLLIMDDNHWLIEWLAYHYFVLPLRHLIVVKDPRSQTSPNPIFERWKDRMVIEEWTDDMFLPSRFNDLAKPNASDRVKFYSSQDPLVLLHRARQQFFMIKCLKELKKRNKGWVLLSDTDEYLLPNPFIPHPSRTPLRQNLQQPGSALAIIRLHEANAPNNTVYRCLHVPRLQMTSRESNFNQTQKNLPVSLLNTSHLLTTRWLWHNGQDMTGPRNQDGKNIIHVGRVAWSEFPERAPTVHYVLPNVCPQTSGGRLRHNESWLLLHHYLGTFQQYTYRDDPRENIQRRAKRRDVWSSAGQPSIEEDVIINTWLPAFIDHVGPKEARRLLQDVGRLEVKAAPVKETK